MRKYLLIICFLTLILFNISFAQPEISSEAVILKDLKTGEIIYEHNAHKRLYPASTTKVLTALSALQRKADLSDKIVPSHYAVYSVPVGSSIAYFSEGEELNLEQVLYGLLLPSGNDAANILAEYVSGDIPSFIKVMNETAKSIGANESNFVTPSGTHDDNHYTTAYDLSLIAKEAMKFSEFRKIVSTYEYIMPKTNRAISERSFINTNKLLATNSKYYYESATGIKTGYTSSAGNCLISSAKSNGVELLCVVLGGKVTGYGESQVYNDTINLFEYGFSQYTQSTLLKTTDIVESVPIKRAKHGKKIEAVVLKDLVISHIKKPNLEKAVSINEGLTLPIKAGQEIGKVSYYLNDEEFISAPLFAKEEVLKEFILITILKVILKILFYVILCAIILIVVLRIFNMFRKKLKKRRRGL